MLSRTRESDDWQIHIDIFTNLDSLWGPHSMDRFATNLNSHCKSFNSRFWCPHTKGVDAFSQNWSGECNWMVPPPRLILRALNKMKKDKAKGKMIIPQWKGAPFWSEIISANGQYKSFVKASKVLPQHDAITRSHHNYGIFSWNPLKFHLIALHVVF